jgi:hypothetical protein
VQLPSEGVATDATQQHEPYLRQQRGKMDCQVDNIISEKGQETLLSYAGED